LTNTPIRDPDSPPTLMFATDDAARKKFRRYWRTFGAGIVLIRWLLLPALCREAELHWRAPGSRGTFFGHCLEE